MKNICNSSYEELVEYYDKVLNNDKSLHRSTNDEATPIQCVEEMVSKLPLDLWKRKNLSILDPCCGNGNFFLVLLYLLKKTKLNEKTLLEDVFHFNDINKDRINIVSHVFCSNLYKLKLTTKDYTTFDTENKYDLIVANPPFARLMENGKRCSKNHNLIRPFLIKSLELLKSGGFLLFITPDNWMSLADRNTIIQKLTSLQIIHLNIHIAKKWFKKIGSSFTWYIIENKPFYKNIMVEGVWKKKVYTGSIIPRQMRFIPLFYTPLVESILQKTILNENLEKFQVETSSDLHRTTKKDLISTEQTNEFKYRIIHTPKQTLYSSRPHKFQSGYKVFLSTTDKYSIFVDVDVGMTQSIAFIRCADQEQAMRYKQILEHPLYVFLNNICRWGNFNNIRILQSFPIPKHNNDIYSSFSISKEEIQHIYENL